MFFGNDREEHVSVSGLEMELGGLFERKLERFATKAAKISQMIAEARRDFISACDEFDRVDDKPDSDFKSWLNPGFIRSQKGAYAAALKRVFSSHETFSGNLSYLRYSAELAGLNSAIDEMLRINGRNRDLIIAYSKHLGRFKALQSTLESCASALGAELGKVSEEYGEYKDAMEKLAKLREVCDEIAALKVELGMFDGGAGGGSGGSDGTASMEAQAAKKRGELETLRDESSAITARVSSLVMPLGKAARTYDHFAMRKAKLAEMVENPMESLSSQERFMEFGKMLSELKESVETGRTQLKKPQETVSLISKIRDAKLYEELERKALVDKEMATVEDEILFLENEMRRIKSVAEDSEARTRKAVSLQNRIASLEASRETEKRSLEEHITKFYKKRFIVVL